METAWSKSVAHAYRLALYELGEQSDPADPEDERPRRRGFSPEVVDAVRAAGGRLPAKELLRCRVRGFSQGVALGAQEFVEEIFHAHRDHFGPKRATGARRLRPGPRSGLFVLRDLR